MNLKLPLQLHTCTILLLTLISLAACQGPTPKTAQQAGDGNGPSSDEARIEQLIAKGMDSVKSQPNLALKDYLNEATVLCDKKISSINKKTYIAKSPEEAMYYLVQAAANEAGETIVIESTCDEAYYFSAFANLDLGRVADAETDLRKALELSPINAIYLNEMGHIQHIHKQWDDALQTFRQAEEFSAITGGDEEMKTILLARAKRGIGYSLIELGELSEAERVFQECLAINPEDANAQNELKYIQSLRDGPEGAE